MIWFDETSENGDNGDIFFNPPSPTSPRPDRIPASWLATCLLFHLRSTRVNQHTLTEFIFKNDNIQNYYDTQFGIGVYPTLSLINHSCDPNTDLVTLWDGSAFLYATRSITEGSEVTVSYDHMTFYYASNGTRQEDLANRYLFDCDCEACAKNWIQSLDNVKKSDIYTITENDKKLFYVCSHFTSTQKNNISTLRLRDFHITEKCLKFYRYLLQPYSRNCCNEEMYLRLLLRIFFGIMIIEPWDEVV